MIWIMKEANTTAQPQPPSGGGTLLPWAPGSLVFTSVRLGDFSLGGEAFTGISLESTKLLAVTGSWLSGPAILESEEELVFKLSLLLVSSVMNVCPET